jgi:virginiamycin A acetyltransferase
MEKRNFDFVSGIKTFLNGICLVLVLPSAVSCWVMDPMTSDEDSIFRFWAHVFSILPGKSGMFLRRAYYRLTLDRCAANFYIGFGALFTHKNVIVEKDVYVGPYALVGSVHLGEGCLIGSRASLLSGTQQHVLDEHGHWGPCDKARLRMIKIGNYAWIGEGAIVMANIGEGTMVAAGAVVDQDARGGILLAGNPSRFVRKLSENPQRPASKSA